MWDKKERKKRKKERKEERKDGYSARWKNPDFDDLVTETWYLVHYLLDLPCIPKTI